MIAANKETTELRVPIGKVEIITSKGSWLPSSLCYRYGIYRGHSREPENVNFMSSCPLYTG